MMCGQNQENKMREMIIGYLSSSSFAIPSVKEETSSEIAMTSPQNGKKRARSPTPTKGRSATAARPRSGGRIPAAAVPTRARKRRTGGLRGSCPKMEAATARTEKGGPDGPTDRLQLRKGRRKGNNNAAVRFAASPTAKVVILLNLEGLLGLAKGLKAT